MGGELGGEREAHLLFATQTMKVRRFHATQAKEHWQFLEGPWEMYIIEAGSVPLGSRVGEAQSNDALQGFTRCKKYQCEYYPLPAHTHTPSTGFLQHDEFWRQWDDIAHERAQLLAQFPCPWDSVATSLPQSNRLLLKCPDRRLGRIARLSQLADFEDVKEEDRFIFHCLQRGCFCPEALPAAQYVLRVLLHNTQHVQNENNTRIARRTRKTRSTAF